MVKQSFWWLVLHTARSLRIRHGLLLASGLTVLSLGGTAANAAPPASGKGAAPVEPAVRMPALPPAEIDNSLTIGGDDIDAREIITRMTVAVRVNGRGPYRFVVDSGADTSVVGTRVARALQLPVGTSARLIGMTDVGRVDRVLVDELELGQSTIRDLQLPTLREGDLGGDGMIGIDALVEQRLMMDFEKHVINVEDARKPVPVMDGDIVITARRRHGQLIITQASANGRPADAVIDTGSEITIGNLALRDRLLHRGAKITAIPVTGVTGVTVNLQLARIDEIQLGSIVMHDVPIAFAEVPPFGVFGLEQRPAMLLGTDLMESFRRVSLDFRARKVRFQLRRCKPTGILISTSASAFSRLSGLSSTVC